MRTIPHWEKVGFYPHHGTLLPLSALRSKKSSGIGEFFDLIPIIDWCSSLGLDVLQILPINDGGLDPSPYNVLSTRALDPVYISLTALPGAAPDLEIFAPLTLNPRINHTSVRQEKLKFLKTYCKNHPRKKDIEQFAKQYPWVKPYVLFKAYKEQYENSSWENWPPEAKNHALDQLKPMNEPMNESEEFYAYLQLLAFEQMKQVKSHATRQKVFLMGDLPILPKRDSADVWAESHLFDLQWSAGAPPDVFNVKGQLWGFPLYRWDEMQKEDFAWWKERLQYAQEFFDLYRIDHVVGFFRIWAGPNGKSSNERHFIPSDPNIWPKQGRELLEMMIQATEMLPLAEDLGIIPDFVRPILKELGICRTCMMRWERNGLIYIPFDQYDPLSMTTVSTPDSESLSLWWGKKPEEATAFAEFMHWRYQPQLTYEQHLEILRVSHRTPSYFHINPLHETLLLLPELNWPNYDERINVPGTFLASNWTFRFRPFVEEMVTSEKLYDLIKHKILGFSH